jgi:uncharacterized protein
MKDTGTVNIHNLKGGRMIRKLNREESNQLLRKTHLGRLGCVVNDEPYIVPVNYIMEEDFVYVHSLPGRKITAMRKNPRTCLQVDDIESDYCWRSVLVFGNFEEVTNSSEREIILKRFYMLFPKLTPVESAIAQDAGPPAIIVFRIRIDAISGISEN